MDTINVMISNSTQKWEFINVKDFPQVVEQAKHYAPDSNINDKGVIFAAADTILGKLQIPIYHCEECFLKLFNPSTGTQQQGDVVIFPCKFYHKVQITACQKEVSFIYH